MNRLFFTWKNPLIQRDLRTRMRGYRAFAILTSHLLFLSLILSLIYLFFRWSVSNITLEEQRIFGKIVFGTLISLELVIISFIAPGLTSSAIASEREHQTYDLLRVTLLSGRSLVLGKYISGLIFILLLLFTSLPLFSPAFLFGSVLYQEILIGFLILLVTAISFCAIGIFFSSLFSKTLLSTVLSYAITIFLVFGIPMILVLGLVLISSLSSSSNISNPGLTAQIMAVYLGWVLVSITPIGVIIAAETILLQEGSVFLFEIPLDTMIVHINVTLLSPWIFFVFFYLAGSLLLLWLSVRLANKIER